MPEQVNPFELAGSSEPPQVAPQVGNQPQEVFPIKFEKDYLDFTGVLPEDEPVVPKASSAPVSAEIPKSVTGLEDVSAEDLETSVPSSVEKGTTLKPVSGL